MSIVGSAEYLKEIRYISFARPDAAIAMAKRREAVERFAQGIDLPPEIVLGHMNTTFVNAGQITEDLFRTHIEPKLLVWVKALTVGYLRPQLMKAAGIKPNDDGSLPELPPEIARARDLVRREFVSSPTPTARRTRAKRTPRCRSRTRATFERSASRSTTSPAPTSWRCGYAWRKRSTCERRFERKTRTCCPSST